MKSEATQSLPFGFLVFLSALLGLFVGLSLGVGLGWAVWFDLSPVGAAFWRPYTIPGVILAGGWIVILTLGVARRQPPQRVVFGWANVSGFALGLGLGLWLAFGAWETV